MCEFREGPQRCHDGGERTGNVHAGSVQTSAALRGRRRTYVSAPHDAKPLALEHPLRASLLVPMDVLPLKACLVIAIRGLVP